MEQYCWHYLHHASVGRTLLERVNSRQVRCVLPHALTGAEEEYVLNMDERDRRTLVAFDGLLLAGSPRREGECILTADLGMLKVPTGKFLRQRREGVIGIAPYAMTTVTASLLIHRHFLLLRWGTFVFAAYDNTNLAPRYLVARVSGTSRAGSEEEEGKDMVEWLVCG